MRVLVLLIALVVSCGTALARQMSENEVAEVIGQAKRLITQEYVDADRAAAIAGGLDSIAVGDIGSDRLARTMQRLLRKESGDLHFEVIADDNEGGSRKGRERSRNYGFRKLEILKGNVGYLKLTYFEYPDKAAAVAHGAMSLLANSDAVIIDLRDNTGGSKAMVQLILSYFFEPDPVHLFSIFGRHDRYYHGYTDANVTGVRMPDKPVYVLQNKRTFSAAEMFAFILHNLGRAVLVGETTAGGGHTVGRYTIGDGLTMNIPVGKVVDPTTGEGWDSVGIQPDVEARGDQVLQRAYFDALEKKRADTMAADEFDVNWQYDILKSTLEPMTVDESVLQSYVGQYERRVVSMVSGMLYYRGRAGIDPALMIPIDENTFRFDEIDYFRVRFVSNEDGKIVGLKGLYDDGYEDYSERTE